MTKLEDLQGRGNVLGATAGPQAQGSLIESRGANEVLLRLSAVDAVEAIVMILNGNGRSTP